MDFVRGYLDEARGHLENAKLVEARAAADRALERDAQHLGALLLLADITEQQGDRDASVHALHRWLDVYDGREGKQDKRRRQAVLDRLLLVDTEADAWEKLQKRYVDSLLTLGRKYRSKKDLLGALDIYRVVLSIAPGNPVAKRAMHSIRTTGGAEVAVEDVFAGGDPTGGLSEEEIAAMDREHADWANAYTDATDNYRYRTNAGYLVLKTSAIAMEQMNRFYRRFFQFQEDGGKTPAIEIRIFKSRDEYLELGRSPAPWSAGHFIGSAVETYTGGVNGKASVRDMYRTLFHEAAHQFVSMTGPMVPGWLNEAYASFFEGCVILSNGTVKWNQAPPGRLFPLARRMEAGWMTEADIPSPQEGEDWPSPDEAPPFRMVVEGNYRWGPPWYAPTWGVVYFLYNYRHEDGRPVYRDALHEYYRSFKRGRPKDPVAHFEELVLLASELSPVQGIDGLDEIWKAWILRLRDLETGKIDAGDELQRFANAALERGDDEMALGFLEEARELEPGNVELLFEDNGVPADLDFLVIDVDSNDYYLWRAIRDFRPKVVMIEVNGLFPPPERKVVDFHPMNYWDQSAYFGASLQSLYDLAKRKGYELVYHTKSGINAFFVDEKYFPLFGIEDNSPESLYHPLNPLYHTAWLGPDGELIPPDKKELVWEDLRIEKNFVER